MTGRSAFLGWAPALGVQYARLGARRSVIEEQPVVMGGARLSGHTDMASASPWPLTGFTVSDE